ncbi:predicted protein [Nematostella vectensis]|uniref:Serine/threonine-protein kinase PLK n=2 Tax=Nematostella vectensis TaxID=45351 RepID=A7SEP8_NEMVE|nr:predicted protein [Nematostella vectensis]|eukprot:XP_001629890.1 predicted protein [Nematostella vectensis]
MAPPSIPRELDQIIVDADRKKRYYRGKFLGKGGFAKCYELTDLDTNKIYAGKIISKSMLTKPHQKEKMAMEIEIHGKVMHKHIVGFHGYFEDRDYIYILLELCPRRSLMELHKRRRALTEPEVRYFMKQIIDACIYLHKSRIIHRDLKLGNLFLNDDMEVKVGDFGLATRAEEGERKKTLCGTPNYIAPEVLSKRGHSFEVDVWSVGCILYTLLVGKPPFETQSLKTTYDRIKRNEYYIPSKVSHTAQLLIIKLLRPDPTTRPTMQQVLDDDFFKPSSGYMPTRLPVSCLTMPPRFATGSSSNLLQPGGRPPLSELNSQETTARITSKPSDVYSKRKSLGIRVTGAVSKLIQPEEAADDEVKEEAEEDETPKDYYLSDLKKQLTNLLALNPADMKYKNEDDAEEPAATPVYWVSKWVDYSDKYGLGYTLSDNSVGVLFNDHTRLILCEDGENLQYILKNGQESFHTMKGFPDSLHKKVTLLKYFRNYMTEHLLKAGGSRGTKDEESAHLPFLRSWFRTSKGIILHLSNGILQINFFKDHTKIIMCPRMGAVTYIDENKRFRTFPFTQIEKHGCSQELSNRLLYAKERADEMLQKMREESSGKECSGLPQQVTAPEKTRGTAKAR